MERQAAIQKDKTKELDSIDLAKFIFAFAVIYIHAGGGRYGNTTVSCELYKCI